MAKNASSRKNRFKAALLLAGMTAADFAELHGITSGHLSQVLTGRESRTLTEKIDAFTKEHITKAALRAG
jgi:transcriptional regulator with XRE-family HTH domain